MDLLVMYLISFGIKLHKTVLEHFFKMPVLSLVLNVSSLRARN